MPFGLRSCFIHLRLGLRRIEPVSSALRAADSMELRGFVLRPPPMVSPWLAPPAVLQPILKVTHRHTTDEASRAGTFVPTPFLFFHNEHVQSAALGPKLMFWSVSRHFVAARHPLRKQVLGCIQCLSLCHRNHFLFFRNEHVQSTTLGPKLIFGVVPRHSGAARHPLRKQV
jgi:hypothetical protein